MPRPRSYHTRRSYPSKASSQARDTFSSQTGHTHRHISHTASQNLSYDSASEGSLNDNHTNYYSQDDDERPQGEGTGELNKRGLKLLHDALMEVSMKKRRRDGSIKYVLLDT